jgi:hypothetical protein
MTKLYLFLFLLTLMAPAGAETNSLWLEYKKNPNSHPQIPNNSYAGYGYGEKKQELFINAQLINIKQFGAKGDGKADDSNAISRALSSIKGNAPIRIYFPNGEYLFSRQIVVNRSFISFSGESRENTKLVFLNSLNEINPERKIGEVSPYAWSRGLLEFRPKIHDEDYNGWGAEKSLAKALGNHSEGSLEIIFSSYRKLNPNLYFIRWNLKKSKNVLDYMAGIPVGEGAQWRDNAKHWRDRKFILWPVEIVSIEKNRAFLKQPLRLPIGLADEVEILAAPDLLRDIRVENLTIKTNRKKASKHLQERGYNGIFVHRVFNGTIQNVDLNNVDNGILLNAVKNITIEKVEIVGSLSTHHGFFNKYAEDVLIQDFKIDAPIIHGINADLRGSGNVWRMGRMKFGTFDLHRGMQFDNIRTNIEINNTGDSGGDVDAGPMQGRRVVHWNIAILNKRLNNILQPEFFPFGALVGIRGVSGFSFKKTAKKSDPKIIDLNIRADPEDLYRAQIDLRMSAKN